MSEEEYLWRDNIKHNLVSDTAREAWQECQNR